MTSILKLEDYDFQKGELVNVVVKSTGFKEVLGYQYTLRYSNQLELLDIKGSKYVAEESFGTTNVAEGILTTSWYTSQPSTIGSDEELFTLTFTAYSNGRLSEHLWIDGSVTSEESYKSGKETAGVQMNFKGSTLQSQQIELFQNEPNPFADRTTIRFYFPESQEATFSIVDVSGKIIRQTTRRFDAGMNQVVLTRDEIGQSGVLYYRLQTADFNGLKKMILVK
ncbi:MAG: T9SS type A sorting domain-containing protein [Saprospiraceae bacterium]